jgi:LysM repeat protein
VYPWVPTSGNTGRKLPLVSGSFGGLDTLASIIVELGNILQETDPFAPGERSKGQKILLVLMRDQFPHLAKYYDVFLSNIEKFKEENPTYWLILYNTTNAISRFLNFVFGMILRAIADQIKKAQTEQNPESTNPTHTQVGKDHYDHPFHELAATLAQTAVTDVGTAMAQYWAGQAPSTGKEYDLRPVHSGDTLVSIAKDYGMTWKELARFNWDTDDPRKINRYLYLEVGCRKPRSVNAPLDELANYWFSDDDHLYGTGTVKVPRQGSQATTPSRDVIIAAVGYIVHPENTSWMDGFVRDWALRR